MIAGARSLGTGARHGALWAGQALRRLSIALHGAVRSAGAGLARNAGPLAARIHQSPVGPVLRAVGGLMLAASAVRAGVVQTLDQQTLTTMALGLGTLTVGALPFLTGLRPLPSAIARVASPRVLVAAAATMVIGMTGLLVSRMAPVPAGLHSIASLVGLPFAGARTISGRASVLDAARLRIGDTVVRLDGIEPPERAQICRQANGRRWRCGDAAVASLVRLVNGRHVTCEITEGEAGAAADGTCNVRQSDVGATLVRAGAVFAQSGLLARYASIESEAKTAKAGLWRGTVERPSEWRDRIWAEARKRAPDGCPIKGHVSRGVRTYLVPGQVRYDRVRVNKARGGRWFCSENEAIAAGWTVAGG